MKIKKEHVDIACGAMAILLIVLILISSTDARISY
jgi:hypothetical protein